MQVKGLFYRALEPCSDLHPLSGEGARATGNRFNPRGTPALYMSQDVPTALREFAQQTERLQPTLLVTIDVEVAPVFDATDEDRLAPLGLTIDDLSAEDWASVRSADGTPRTQDFARHLMAEGYAALLVPSFCTGSARSDRNLVLWRWGSTLPARAVLVDDDQKLSGR